MTTPKEALELKGCPFCGANPHTGKAKAYRDQLHGELYQDFSIWCPKGHAKVTRINREQSTLEWNTRATASLQGEDAVERVARIISSKLKEHPATADELPDEFGVWCARTILAIGLVPDEVAIRADEREKCARVADSKRRSVREFSVAADIAAAIRSNQAKP